MRRTAICLLLILSLVACGQDPKEEAYERLQNQVAAIRDAAEAGEATTAVQRLTSLRTNVAELRADDVITEAETQKILTAALQVQANLPLIMTAPPAPAPAPPPAPSGNAGGSIRGGDGEDGHKGERGEDGKKGGNGDKDD